MTTILPNSQQLGDSNPIIRPQMGLNTSVNLEKSLSIKPPTLQTNMSISPDPTIIQLNQLQLEMQPSQSTQNQSLQLKDANIHTILQNAKTPAPIINEKIQRCTDFKQGKYGPIPTCFRENSPKEELVLEHVNQYKRQFKLVYDEERELFLFPKNECDYYKVTPK